MSEIEKEMCVLVLMRPNEEKKYVSYALKQDSLVEGISKFNIFCDVFQWYWHKTEQMCSFSS